ncbi:MAG: ClbS/DfsB family four-helix bundle protein [Gemmatimonadota bacterium]|nr:ClbS/DfsB family four-helix bundle protein [Gemmatimonadota bacterium]MDH5197895.1 ClbS/DfsB family four-helix bundle protein [Gemmatimonadota bacterium]
MPQAKLLEPGHYPWTGRYPLTTYLAPNTSSHYRTATKILKRWLKGETRHG